MIGRRVASWAEIEQPGDYFGPVTGYTGPAPGVSAEDYLADTSLGLPAVFFLLPNSRDEDAPAGQRSVHHVCSPPHVFRECPDGSLEIRESIGAMPYWHGYLDEGHVWRSA